MWSTTDRRGANVTGAAGKGSEDAKAKDAQGTPAKDGNSDDWRQVSRLGNPLVNEVVVPLKYKDAFNALSPEKDATVTPVVDKVKDPIVPKLIQNIYKVPAPATPRNDLVEIFLTGICKECGPIKADLNSQRLNQDVDKAAVVPAEMLRLNMSVPPAAKPNRLGVLGKDLVSFPNGPCGSTTTSSTSSSRPSKAPPRPGRSCPPWQPATPSTPLPRARRHLPLRRAPQHRGRQPGRLAPPRRRRRRRLGGLASGDGFPVVPVTALGGGALLAIAGVLALRRRRGTGQA